MLIRIKLFNFNSHAHVERDVAGKEVEYLVGNFNSHAHVERDDVDVDTFEKQYNFNSHAHVERDRQAFHSGLFALQFQLTRSRGA